MPAKAGIHIHRPVLMDSGFRRNDNAEQWRFPIALRGAGGGEEGAGFGAVDAEAAEPELDGGGRMV